MSDCPEDGDGLVIVLLRCDGCEGVFGTTAVAGPHECPSCGYITRLYEIDGPGDNGYDSGSDDS